MVVLVAQAHVDLHIIRAARRTTHVAHRTATGAHARPIHNKMVLTKAPHRIV